MQSANNSRYLPINLVIPKRYSFEYTDWQKNKIVLYFPEQNRRVALKETEEHVSKLIGWLCSEITPKNIKRSERNQQLLLLRRSLQKLEKQIDSLSKKHKYLLIELKSKFHKIYREGLEEFQEMIWSLKLICDHIISTQTKCGWKDEALHDAVRSLCITWKKYTGKKPTRKNIKYECDYDEFNIRQKECGEFLGYLNASIKSAVNYVNKKYRKRIHLPNINYVARQITHPRYK